MRILADENCDREIVEALRNDGHDVVWASETFPSSEDLELYAIAVRDGLLLLTQDQDFSALQRFQPDQLTALVTLRFGKMPRADRPSRVASVFRDHGERLFGHVTVIEATQVRKRTLGL